MLPMSAIRPQVRYGDNYLFLCNGILHETKVCQSGASAQAVDIAHLFHQVRGQHERSQIRQLLANPPVHILDAVARAQEGVQTW